jgi:TRADD-N domain-containing protein
MYEYLLIALKDIVPPVTAMAGVMAALFFLLISRGSARPDSEKRTQERISTEIEEEAAKGHPPQNTLMREYHTQGLSQSRVSFWFSLIFASLGFAIIALAVGIFLQSDANSNAGWLDTAGKPIFTLIAGTVIDAVAALFFVQSNKARQLMTEFFDKLRVDRKLDEALGLMSSIPDPAIASRVKGIVALAFAEVTMDSGVLGTLLDTKAPTSDQREGSQGVGSDEVGERRDAVTRGQRPE